LLEGPGIYERWFEVTPPLLEPIVFAGNSSLLAVGARLDVKELALVVNVALGLGMAAMVAWRKPSRETIGALALILALLTGPVTWPGYTLVLLPVFFAAGWWRVMPAVVLLAVPYWAVIDLDVPGNPEAVRFLVQTVYFLGVAVLGALLTWAWWAATRPPGNQPRARTEAGETASPGVREGT
jgi:hypothetical protein